MASRSMALDVLVRLRDNLSGGLRRLKSGLQGVADMGRKIGVVGTAVAAISFMAPIEEAAAFQQKLIDIAGTAGLSGQAAFDFVDKMKSRYEELALSIGQTSDTVAAGAGQMIAAGVDEKLIDASLGSIGKAATAANAEFSDMAGVATALLTTLKVPADELDGALAGLITSGKEGAFEMKDMARYLPTLTGQMAKFGVTGREAVNFLGAALQVAKRGTADPAEAANNLKNFLSKILAPTTVKNFKDMGVDIEAVMKEAATKGINPVEAVMQKIVQLTGVSGEEIQGLMKKAAANGLQGAEALAYAREELEKIHGAGALGNLFSDMQVMDFLIPFLGNVDEFKRIKQEVTEATGGVIDQDFETQMAGLNRQLVTFKEIGAQAGREVGFAFGSWLPVINSGLAGALKWFRETDAATSGLLRKGLALAGGAVLLAGALGTLGVVLPIVGAGFAALALLLSPVGIAIAAIVAAIAGAAVLISRNWESIKAAALSAWEGIKTAGQAALSFLQGLWDGLKSTASDLWGGLTSTAGAAWDGIKFASSAAAAGVTRVWAASRPYMKRIWGDLKAGAGRAFDGIIGTAATAWRSIAAGAQALFANIDWGSVGIAAIGAFDRVVTLLKSAFESLKAIGSGIAPSLAPIGDSLKSAFGSLGETFGNIQRLGAALVQLGAALMKLMGFDAGTASSSFETIGKVLGVLGQVTAGGIELLAKSLALITGALADLAEWAAGGTMPDWLAIFPAAAGSAVKAIADAVGALWGYLQTPIALQVLPWDVLSSGFEVVYNQIVGWLDAIAAGIDKVKSAIGMLAGNELSTGGGVVLPEDAYAGASASGIGESVKNFFNSGGTYTLPAANSNTPADTSVAQTPRGASAFKPASDRPSFSAVAAPPQAVQVGGDIRIKVDGPGHVTGATSDNKAVAISADRGRAVGRV